MRFLTLFFFKLGKFSLLKIQMKNSHKHFLPRYFHSVCFSLSLGKFKSLKCIPLMICDSKSILWSHDWWSLIPAIGGVLIAINFNWLTSSFLILLFKTYIFLEHFFIWSIYIFGKICALISFLFWGGAKNTRTHNFPAKTKRAYASLTSFRLVVLRQPYLLRLIWGVAISLC